MKEWYLMTSNTRPNIVRGYGSDTYKNYRSDAFAESLETDIATTVILFNYDLSESQKIRCIIQGNTPDTHLKSMERIGLFQIGTVKAGMYIYFEDRYWLITGYPGTNGIYEKATLQLCQYCLKWQNSSGKIIERWISATSASKYDVGEGGNNVITLSTNNLSILTPNDDESLNLHGKRVFIDKRTEKPERVFKLTRTDDILYDYGESHGGIFSFIADKTELNLDNDRPDLKLCDYIEDLQNSTLPPISNETTNLSATISGSSKINCGFSREYFAIFADEDGEEIHDVTFDWNIVADFDVKATGKNNVVELLVDDKKFIGNSFLLQIFLNGKSVAEKEITVIDKF